MRCRMIRALIHSATCGKYLNTKSTLLSTDQPGGTTCCRGAAKSSQFCPLSTGIGLAVHPLVGASMVPKTVKLLFNHMYSTRSWHCARLGACARSHRATPRIGFAG